MTSAAFSLCTKNKEDKYCFFLTISMYVTSFVDSSKNILNTRSLGGKRKQNESYPDNTKLVDDVENSEGGFRLGAVIDHQILN